MLAQFIPTQPTGPLAVVLLACFVGILVIVVIGSWKIFTKAGLPGWAVLVPPYWLVTMWDLTGLGRWFLLVYMVPYVSLFVWGALMFLTATSFGYRWLYALGLFFLWPIFDTLLGIGSRQYVGPSAGPPLDGYDYAPQPELGFTTRRCLACGGLPPATYVGRDCPECAAQTIPNGPTFAGVLSSRTALGTAGFTMLMVVLTVGFVGPLVGDHWPDLWPPLKDPATQWGVLLGVAGVTAVILLCAPWTAGGCSRFIAVPGGMLITPLNPAPGRPVRHAILPMTPDCAVTIRSVSETWARLSIQDASGRQLFAAGVACGPGEIALLAHAVQQAVSRPPPPGSVFPGVSVGPLNR